MVTENTFSEFDDLPEPSVPSPEPAIEPVADTIEVSDTPAPVDETPTPPAVVTPEPTPLPSSDQSQLEERLAQQAEQLQTIERDRQIQSLEKEALDMERRLTDQGLSESEARTQTMSHLQGRVNQIQAEEQQKQQQQAIQGKRNAAVHFAKQYGLGIDDLVELERANNPNEMEAIARTKSTIAKQAREIEELKRGQAQPQSFDNNSPAATTASSDSERLLDLYNQGDRSPAVVAAVNKLQGM